MSESADRDVRPLPEAVRVRVVALTAEVLPQVASLPPALRKVSAFAPQRRARMGSTPIAAALTADPEFRGHVVTQVLALRPELGGILDGAADVADPADVAAMAWL